MKIRVGVFFGGKSVEHEVSVITAMQAIAALDEGKYQPVPIYTAKDGAFYWGAAAGKIESYRNATTLPAMLEQVDLENHGGTVKIMRRNRRRFGGNCLGELDVALLAYHGTAGEDGAVQGLMEHVGLPYTGCDVQASACGMDKRVMKALFADAGLPVLPSVTLGRNGYFSGPEAAAAQIEGKIGYPAIVKPVNLGSSVGISRANNREELAEALETAFEYAHSALCEKAVQPLREINCAVLGDRDEAIASVCEEPLLAGDVLTFQDKYQRGGSKEGGKASSSAAQAGSKSEMPFGTKSAGMESLSRRIPADIPDELAARIKGLAVDAFRAIGAAGVSRVDFLMNADTMEVWVNEINTIPGSLAFYLWQAGGLEFPGLLDRMISLALKRQRENERISFSFEANLLKRASPPHSIK